LLACYNSETFALLLQLFTIFATIQNTWLDHNVLKTISLLTRFDFSIIQPHFITNYENSLKRASIDTSRSDPTPIFEKFRRYIPHVTLADIHAIVQHPLDSNIQGNATSSHHTGENAFKLLVSQMATFPDDSICKAELRKADFRPRPPVPR
jgi:hypothetical protein